MDVLFNILNAQILDSRHVVIFLQHFAVWLVF